MHSHHPSFQYCRWWCSLYRQQRKTLSATKIRVWFYWLVGPFEIQTYRTCKVQIALIVFCFWGNWCWPAGGLAHGCNCSSGLCMGPKPKRLQPVVDRCWLCIYSAAAAEADRWWWESRNASGKPGGAALSPFTVITPWGFFPYPSHTCQWRGNEETIFDLWEPRVTVVKFPIDALTF